MTEHAVEPTTHARLGASSSKRWMNCPGSIRETRGLPPSTNEYAEEGTAMHAAAALALKEGLDAVELVDRKFGDFTVDEDAADAIQLYLDTVRHEYDDGDTLFVETQFSLAPLDPPAEMFGTADAAVFKPKARRLVVLDFKFGAGVTVDATDNSQGRYYALGAALALGDRADFTEVEVVIVQPRAPHKDGPVRRETVSAADLLDWSADLLAAAQRTVDPAAPLKAGEWCRFCGAAPTCPELRKRSTELAQIEFSEDMLPRTTPPDPATLTPEQLGRLLEAFPIIDRWMTAVRMRALQEANEGRPIPGWKIVEKRKRRYWRDLDEAIVASLATDYDMPVDDLYSRKLKTPAQILKLIRGRGAGDIRKRLEKQLVEKRSSGATLAPENDARPAVESSAALDFLDAPPVEESE